MPHPPSPLPPDLRGQAFRVADHPELSQDRLAASDLWSPARGIRLPARARDLRSRCIAHTLTLPVGSAFSHSTAARLHRLPLPTAPAADETIHVTVPSGTRAPRRKDLVGHQRALEEADWIDVGRLRVTTLARTFLDLADVLDVPALVAVGDRMLWRRDSLLQLADLTQAVELAAGRSGARTAREALDLLDDGADSAKESELRLLLLESGFGPFASNFELRDSGRGFVARVDLALPHLRIAIEYEGDHHRDKEQWRRDIARRRRIEALGWIYLPVTQADLDDPRKLLADLASAIVRRG